MFDMGFENNGNIDWDRIAAILDGDDWMDEFDRNFFDIDRDENENDHDDGAFDVDWNDDDDDYNDGDWNDEDCDYDDNNDGDVPAGNDENPSEGVIEGDFDPENELHDRKFLRNNRSNFNGLIGRLTISKAFELTSS